MLFLEKENSIENSHKNIKNFCPNQMCSHSAAATVLKKLYSFAFYKWGQQEEKKRRRRRSKMNELDSWENSIFLKLTF